MTEEIGGRKCHIFTRGQEGPAIYWAISAGRETDMVEKLASRLKTMCRNPWVLIAFETESWDRDLSPWPALELPDGRGFSGGAKATLDWLLENSQKIENRYGCEKRAVGGYSLSGLFALWAFYESGSFDAAGSFSGSLWYPGWDDYASGRKARPGSAVYLSLGTKEEKTRNKVMASVGDATRAQYERLCADENVRESALVWSGGGHSSEPDMRTARGFAWIAEHI